MIETLDDISGRKESIESITLILYKIFNYFLCPHLEKLNISAYGNE